MKGVAARKLAVDVLVRVEREKAFANLALSSAFDQQNLSERDRAFATALVQGVLRHRDELDAVIASSSSQALTKMPARLKNILRVAIFQLRYMDDIPQSAVVNTATEIAKTTGHAGLAKFVTGVLRGHLRKVESGDNAEESADSDESDDPIEKYARRYSMPRWLVRRWLSNFGEPDTAKLLDYAQSVPVLTVRTCESGVTPEALLNVFTSSGIKAHHGELVDACLIIEDRGEHKGPIDKLPGYADGLFIVQDEAAAFVSKVVDPKPGEVIVDLCAAPGGKTINLADAMEGKGRVLAVDSQERRLELLKRTRQRVGLTNIEIFTEDGTTFDPKVPVNRVLLDAPCTGTGVINRRSDLRYQRDEPSIESLVQLQRRLLTNAARILSSGGTLVYSTCSLEPEENEQNLKWFLLEHTEFKLAPLTPYVPPRYLDMEREAWERGWIQLSPARHQLSGFFVARLLKD